MHSLQHRPLFAVSWCPITHVHNPDTNSNNINYTVRQTEIFNLVRRKIGEHIYRRKIKGNKAAEKVIEMFLPRLYSTRTVQHVDRHQSRPSPMAAQSCYHSFLSSKIVLQAEAKHISYLKNTASNRQLVLKRFVEIKFS